MNREGPAVAAPRVGLDLLLEVAGDEDQLGDIESLEPVHHPVHHRTARDLEQRLGNQVGVRPEPGALARQRDDDLHVQPFRSGRSAEPGHRASGVEASSTSVSVIASIWCTVRARMRTDSPARKVRSSRRSRGADPEDQLSGEDVHGFILAIVILEAQARGRP